MKSENKYVDLGLPNGTLWATCNIGASKPEELGSCFSWGETTPKETSQASKLVSDNDSSDFEDYVFQFDDDDLDELLISKYTDTDKLTILQPEDDAATVCWGTDWQMPTDDEWSELLENCEWEWVQHNGITGYKGTGANGNWIFFPVSTESDETIDMLAQYWTSSIYDKYNAYGLEFSYESIYLHDIKRQAEALIRPVRNQNQHPIYFTVSFYALEYNHIDTQKVEKGKSANIKGFVVPEKYGHTFVGWDKSVDNITSNTDVYAVYERIPFTNHDFVDLGLPSHTLWATCNVGATKPEESGDYFMWGDTEPKMQLQRNAKLKAKGDATEEFPYNFRFIKKFKPERDAATTNWGDPWITPTLDHFIELKEHCQWTWTMQNEVYGYKVIGPNGNHIFLPATGEYRYKDLLNVGKMGGYWTCTSMHMSSMNSFVFQFDPKSSKLEVFPVEIRFTVRPIQIIILPIF